MRNQAFTGLQDTSYRIRMSEGKRWRGLWQLVLLLLVFVDERLEVLWD